MLILKNIIKDYKIGTNDKVRALDNVSVNFEKAGFVSILGQSGCGKTTLLNIIGGLDHYTNGDLIIDGISTVNYKDKDWDLYRNNKIGFVFQSYNLIPQLSILENVEIPLSLNGESASSRRKKAKEALKKVGLENEFKKKPNQLSGGQMQRVAIARSLVNDPDVILADEPTGALDSKTSVVVMNILKEISKTKLVIMVTHNETLAETYSTRIISMKDGKIVNDTAKVEAENESSNREITGKTSMNLVTSIKMSLKNIAAKKGRVAMVSVASSFGVIGVGLVLALSNGFTGYIDRVEQSTASNAPIAISASSVSYKINDNTKDFVKFPEEENIHVYDPSKNQTITQMVHKNKIDNEFLDYLDNIDNTEKYKGTLASKLVNYTLPQYAIVTKAIDNSGYTMFDSNTKISNMTASLAGYTSLPNTIFHELYGDQEYIEQTYDVIKGTYPRNEMYPDVKANGKPTFDVALIIDQYNRIDKSTLISLGLISEDFKEETISFDDLLNAKIEFYPNDEIYYFNENNPDDLYDTAVSRLDPAQQIDVKNQNGEVIVSVNFPEHREVQYYDYAKDQSALEKLSNNTFTYKKDGADYTASGVTLNISGIIRVNKQAMTDYMPTSLAYTNGFKEYADNLNKNSNISKNIQQNVHILDEGLEEFQKYVYELYSDPENVSNTDLVSKFNRAFATWIPFTTMAQNEDGTINGSFYNGYYVGGYGTSLKKIYGFGGDIVLPSAVKVILDKYEDVKEEDFEDMVTELALHFVSNKDDIIPTLNYISKNLNSAAFIDSVVLFPTSLNNKVLLKEYLDNYNIGKEKDDQIVYSDIIGALTDGLGEMINIISIVLVVFASISLVVSCVMTGIITYNSVLERTKEIGVLRAVGARKKDVGRLFKVESLLIGILSGIIGVVFTYLISVPINIILNAIFPDYNIGNIANLAILAAVVLVVISGLLAFVSGIIPARVAARKDPVIALRSE